MSSGGRWLRWIVLLGLVALVYAPLQNAAPIGDDPRVLATVASMDRALGGEVPPPGGARAAPGDGHHAEQAEQPPPRPPRRERGLRVLFGLERDGVGWLGALSLVASSRLWRGAGTWSEASLYILRLENLALLLVAAVALGRFVRRLLKPWTSFEHAHTAGIAATFLLALHPLAPSAVSSPASRGDLIAAALLCGASALFLRGRQRRQPRRVMAAGALVLLAGLASEMALLVAPLLFLAELASARRNRPAKLRRRTALTTLGAFGVLSASGIVLRLSFELSGWPARFRRGLGMFDGFGDAFSALALGFERIGVLLFPINAEGTGLFDFVALGLLLMVVLHPAFSAARAAPRLWSAVLAAWLTGVALTQIPLADLRVHPSDWTHARQLLPGAAVMAAGLAAAATAVMGRRRYVVPAVTVLGLGLLARVDADCLNRAGRPVKRLQEDLLGALERHGPSRNVLVVDPPGLVRAHLAVAPALSWLVDPSLVGTAAPAPGASVRGLSHAALLELLRQPEAGTLRAPGLVVHVPLATLGIERRGAEHERVDVLLGALETSGDGPPIRWGGEGASPELRLDPTRAASLLAVPPRERPPLLPPLVRWRASHADARLPRGVQGTWAAGEEGTSALFDLGGNLPWVLAGRVERLWLEGGAAEPERALLAAELPPLVTADAPLARGADWVFELAAGAPEPLEGEQRFALSLLDLATLSRFELPGYLGSRGELVVHDVEPTLRRLRRAGGPIAWTLEHRAGGRALARSAGRLH